MLSRLRNLAASAIGVVAFPLAAVRAQRADSTGTILGVVVSADGGARLGNSMASIPARGIERLANERGEFVITNVRGKSTPHSSTERPESAISD